MIIAVALKTAGEIADTLEETEVIKLYETKNKRIKNYYESNVSKLDMTGKIAYIKSEMAEVLFIKEFGDEETEAFGPYSLQVYVNSEGDPDELVEAYLEGAYEKELEEALESRDQNHEYTEETSFIEDPKLYNNIPPINPVMEMGQEFDDCHKSCQDTCDCTPESNCGCLEDRKDEE